MAIKTPAQKFKKGAKVIGSTDAGEFIGVVFTANWQPIKKKWFYTVKQRHNEGERIRSFECSKLRAA